MFGTLRKMCYFCSEISNKHLIKTMKRMYFDTFSKQALQELHRYRVIMFSPTMI